MAKGINLGRQLTQQELEGLSIKQLERLINKEVRFQNQLRRELESKGLEEFSESYQKAKRLAEERVVKQLPSAALVKREDFNKKKALIEYYTKVASANRAQGSSVKGAQAKLKTVKRQLGEVGYKKAKEYQRKINTEAYNKYEAVWEVDNTVKENFSSDEVIDIYDEAAHSDKTIKEVLEERKESRKLIDKDGKDKDSKDSNETNKTFDELKKERPELFSYNNAQDWRKQSVQDWRNQPTKDWRYQF